MIRTTRIIITTRVKMITIMMIKTTRKKSENGDDNDDRKNKNKGDNDDNNNKNKGNNDDNKDDNNNK